MLSTQFTRVHFCAFQREQIQLPLRQTFLSVYERDSSRTSFFFLLFSQSFIPNEIFATILMSAILLPCNWKCAQLIRKIYFFNCYAIIKCYKWRKKEKYFVGYSNVGFFFFSVIFSNLSVLHFFSCFVRLDSYFIIFFFVL